MFFGGVEGGATHSNLVICDAEGQVVGRGAGPGTNHWTLGIDECAARVLAMLRDAKQEAGIPLDQPLDALGLTLSGCEQESSNAELSLRVRTADVNSASLVYVASDTAGSLATAAPHGGMVLIAGTGSNGFLHTADGKHFGCGGWGHLLGDEGGAYWIAHRAVKAVFDDADGLRASPHDVSRVWSAVRAHFRADCRADLLPYAYKHFDKSFFAGLTQKLSLLADEGDALSRHLFASAGAALAGHAAALARRARGGDAAGPLRVVCVGSVWKSWRYMRPGALRELEAQGVSCELELVRLRVSSAMGAAWLAARAAGHSLPRDDSQHCAVFHTYRPAGLSGDTNGPRGDTNRQCGDTNGQHGDTNGLEKDEEGCGCTGTFSWS